MPEEPEEPEDEIEEEIITSILEGELAATIAEALLDARVPFTIAIPRQHQEEPPPGWPSWQPWEAPITTTLHKCKGFIETYSELLVSAGVVSAEDVKIVVLATTVPSGITIELTDIVQAQGKTFTILGISTDPAGATIELRARA